MPANAADAALHRELAKTGYEAQHKRDAHPENVDLHHHDAYELYFLLSGEVSCTVEGRRYLVTPGDILLISPRELHKLHISAGDASYERYVLWLSPRLATRLSSKKTDLLSHLDSSRPGYRNQLRMTPEDRQRMYGLIERLLSAQQGDAYGDDLISEALLTLILVSIGRIAARQDAPGEELSLTSPLISGVLSHIDAHYGEPLSLDALAEQFFVSKYHLSHEFSRLVGTSVHRYLLKKRLLIARQLMAQGKRPNEVFAPCGFGDYTGFYRAFEAEYGMSPREYADAVLPEAAQG